MHRPSAFRAHRASLVLVLSAALSASPAQAEAPAAALAEKLLAALKAGDYGACTALFDENMAAAVPEAQLSQLWSGLPAQVGSLQGHGETRMIEEAGHAVAVIPLYFEQAVLDLKVVAGPTGKIGGMFLAPSDEKPPAQQPPAGQPQATQTQSAATQAATTRTEVTPTTATQPSAAEPAPSAPPAGSGSPVDVFDRLIAALDSGDFEAATTDFSDLVREQVSAEVLAQVWAGLEQQYGSLERMGETRVTAVTGYVQVIQPMHYERRVLDLIVAVDEQGRIGGLRFIPAETPAEEQVLDPPPEGASFTERALVVDAGLPLGATLTIPGGDGPFPGVVLVHGSGPNDRDETVGPNKPLRDIAWGLAERGVAVLRYDKRTKAHAQAVVSNERRFTVRVEVVADAIAAVRLLADQSEVDAERVFLAGHSLGGYLAPRIAAATPDLAGAIVLAGLARPLEGVIVEQHHYLLGLDGSISDAEQAVLEELEAQAALVRSGDLTLDTPTKNLPLGLPAAYWLDLRGYDPCALAAQVPIPWLVIQGERDYQVTMKDFDRWVRALRDRGDAVLTSHRELNHLMAAGTGLSTPAEYQQARPVDERVIADMADFITDGPATLQRRHRHGRVEHRRW